MVGQEREPESESYLCLNAARTEMYQSKAGSVLWPAIRNRPEMPISVNMHLRQTKSSLRDDMETLDRVFDYFVNTPDLGLVLGGLGRVVINATVDTSCKTHEGRKSYSKCTFHIGEGSGAFMSRSKEQSVTTDSSTVAEFIAIYLAAEEISARGRYW